MRGQSHLLQISNSLVELSHLLPHLEEPARVDLGAHLREIRNRISSDSGKGLEDIISGQLKSSLMPVNVRSLLSLPRECRGGSFRAVLSAQERRVFQQKRFQVDHPADYAAYCETVTVPVFSYKPRG